MTLILGKSIATAKQMSTYLLSVNKSPKFSRNISAEEFCQLFLDVCAKEGVRGDIAFCQSLKETGNFAFKGDVKYTQNNFAGIGATGGVSGCSFSSIEEGILAQAQHLKTYATKDALNEPCVDPRRTAWFINTKGGTATHWENLSGTWAVPGYDTKKYSSLDAANKTQDSYGYQIIGILNKILNMETKEGNNMSDNLDIKKCFLVNNDCYKQGRKIKPSGIVVHSTGANNPYLKRYIQPNDGILGANANNNHWNRSGVSKCVHAFIGKDNNGNVRIYQTLPWDYRCWGCASGKNGSYNNSYIQFEICEDTLNNEKYFNEAFMLAAKLCKYLCNKYGISINNVVSHREACKRGYASNHGDCDHWLNKFGKDMNWFRGQVANNNAANNHIIPTPETLIQANTYTVQKGDTLSKIGSNTGVAWKTIANLNGIKFPYIVKAGQVLKLTTNTTTPTSIYTHTDFVKEVQAAIGAKVDGIAGNETLSKTVTVSKTKNNRHAVVKPIQKYLDSLGYDVGKIDGVAGTKFDKAVKEYQRANTGVIDGEITAKSATWKKLLKLI